MTGFTEKNGVLHVDNIALPDIAKEYGTPCYVYSASVIKSQFMALKEAMERALPADRQPLLCYACKANTNIAILKFLQTLGSGLEIVSEGELLKGLKAGFTGNQIISTSFGKNESEIKACLEAGILQFNIEAPEELENVNKFAAEMNRTANVVFRLNPNISGGGHSKISTGRKGDKFGNTAEDILTLYKRAEEMSNVTPVGLAIHIGSQISQVEVFKPGFEKLAELVGTLRAQGHTVTHTDIGGGFPIIYNDETNLDLDAYAQWVRDIILPLDTQIQMEPGRYMVGNAGILLSKIQYIKATPSKNFVVLDAAMNDLIRPTLYEAYHGIRPVLGHNAPMETYDIVGPICESGDVFAKNREIPTVSKDDLVVIQSAGAYGFAMASNYNTRTLPPEILVDGDNIAVINKGQTLEELMSRESIPDWL
ncbi:MAG: diaminopimelate decarboxylase [Alphaproteobacteria bacterium]|nr:MAG: diaminopimelate decarboxylase [Alphaproteobacteria bacterium]